MVKKIVYLLPLLVGAGEDFISHYEYGQMLYNNPRGVSCVSCHGERGEGATIVEYRDIHGNQAIQGPDIRNKTKAQMLQSVNRYHRIMPKYYLTTKEVETIYDYIQKRKAYERGE